MAHSHAWRRRGRLADEFTSLRLSAISRERRRAFIRRAFRRRFCHYFITGRHAMTLAAFALAAFHRPLPMPADASIAASTIADRRACNTRSHKIRC